ncbi:MAG: type II toxin-antitoxin system death-on-curing family toxin [Myxococcota bacterium]|nr:type II toxin-antitoxin system death-on-curing family toxin [Myxococcota bacterium]
MTIEFLTVADVLDIHQQQVERFGGSDGIRDMGLLESAVSQPMATFDQVFVHGDVFEMAAAYLFHIVANHPFVDGNKRTGLLTALVFLDINGFRIEHSSEALYGLTMQVASGTSTKDLVAMELKRIVSS